MSAMPMFYADLACKRFQSIYGTEPNVLQANARGSVVEVTLSEWTDTIFPSQVEGVPVIYTIEDRT